MKELLKALAAIKKELRPAQMTGENKFDGYEYLTETDIMAAIDPLMIEHGVVLIKSTETVESLGERLTSQKKTEHAVRVKMTGTFYHAESGESLSISSFGDGQDRGDKGIYKAMTGASKYLMSKAFGLATGDDPERDSQEKPDKGGNSSSGASSDAKTPTVDDMRKQVEAAAKAANIPMKTVEVYYRNETGNEYSAAGPKNLSHLITLIEKGDVYDPNENVPS